MRAAGQRRWLTVVVLLAGVAVGCQSDGSGAVANALLNTGIAMSSAAVQRASGGCYAVCPVGTACDTHTGYCEPLPCRGQCRSDERCVQLGTGERCESLALPEGGLDVHPAPSPAKPSDAPRKESVPSP
ncbi:hypothetical protein HPC49_46910 [Pyxidicoccus fallax]|uniref:Lipoprotein n=1 Tax=Pyxidicoccus fallax TaxID=394095 RepID=A0A848LYD6_9BACT|nr:hypothetical protein [Pyxidicoccus fallax]NMO23095.1 hypothetical protein [Pyxidicoccus fallax]NPC85709.1 hypothetical protein [Pyxidicoccus fallax]